MFEKKFIELFIVILYWLHFTPYIYRVFTNKNYLRLNFGQLGKTLTPVLIFVLLDIIVYVIFYRLVMYGFKELEKPYKRKLEAVYAKYKSDTPDIEAQYKDNADKTKKPNVISKIRGGF